MKVAFVWSGAWLALPRQARAVRCGVERSDSASFLDKALDGMKFGYETPIPRGAQLASFDPPCELCPFASVRYKCSRGHIVRSVVGSPACRVCPTCLYEVECIGARQGRGSALERVALAALAENRNGRLMSSSYSGIKQLLDWECSEGHRWKATAANIRSGTWCPKCAQASRKLTIDDMKATAAQFGGECISNVYLGSAVKLRWRCARGHVFEMAPNNIRRSPNSARKASWCRQCKVLDRQVAQRQNGLDTS